ncbi:FAD-dependent oxidoreductase [Roseobacter sp. HKCCD9010]|uniref:NAD(P)/FAD-dependent oxidoreductase n=1 Tax=unclassified Roseobacter TaxID=196798 RepID=UPI001492E9A4|nr:MULTISPECIES: FAD-binding oxidoreductase [unclassified Roseobacter]MBF9050947.1 FAD-dependent oxidoreductase [Rhodobacterales bacterium HKCCD4356]NNV12716.1 FAD-dependent oxidoreductase [Roseobacter sp. HKCCD7357]NNV16660.1 FAD-dependent oxidoreductase [Roseobacter sp. HKCCD8768]NNV26708.1 FAD-dependent oxidoreductase [Roseobacter sp. HKCCD8192]NNV30379.1 FAD-dependent oxidoreductase [Roseobacter sp. HKCCD9061]
MTDVTVHGAGVFGLSVAWACACRGATVRVIDPNGVGQWASNGLVGALAPHVPENWNDKKQMQFDSLVMAETMWAEVAELSGEDPGYARLGRLQPILDEAALALAEARVESAKPLWQGRFTWQIVPQDTYAPYATSPTGFLIHDTLSARAHPRRCTAALAKALTAIGVEITTDGAAVGKQVWATGVAGLVELSDALGTTVGNGVKGQAALLDFSAPEMPQLFADSLHIIPHTDGTTAIGSTSERDYTDPGSTDAQLDALIAKARTLCPPLAEAKILTQWAGLRPRARSRAPMLGHHPTKPGQFIANGGFKIGFGMAPIIGEIMAELILDNHDRIPESFRPEASLRKS